MVVDCVDFDFCIGVVEFDDVVVWYWVVVGCEVVGDVGC